MPRLQELELHGREAEVGSDLGHDRRPHPPPVERAPDGAEALELRGLRRQHPQRDPHQAEADDDARGRPCHAQDAAGAAVAGDDDGDGVGDLVRSGDSSGREPVGARSRRCPPVLPADRYRGQASVSLFQERCSVSGMTRVSPTAVMKFVSPDQRGRTWRCTWAGIPAPAARPRLAPMFSPSGS